MSQVRHEEMAAFMASAHAKFTGQVGLCYATSGPGAIHLLTGLYDAKADHVCRWWRSSASRRAARSAPATSKRSTCRISSRTWQSEYVMTAVVPEQVRTCIDRAVRIAQAKRCSLHRA